MESFICDNNNNNKIGDNNPFNEWEICPMSIENYAYASSVPSGTIQYCVDGTSKISVDSQHNADGVYENTTK